jgi:hypothetical protein
MGAGDKPMFLRRIVENLRVQNWTAISIDFLIVVVGVFLGIQASNWNQARLEKAGTQRLLMEIAPELRSQLQFIDSARTYFATTRRYADQAFAGWKSDPRITDEQFVIAAYQASQITAIGINPESWSVTFGGAQLREIENRKVRRNLELMLTSDYSPLTFTSVATAYREQVRHVIPTDIQEDIRRECGDQTAFGKDGGSYIILPPTCGLKLKPAEAAATAAALRARPDLVRELNWHIAAIASYLANADALAVPMRQLQRDLSTGS